MPRKQMFHSVTFNGISYGDGMEVTVDRVYLESLGAGETTQEYQMIFQASSVVAKEGIGHSSLMDGILALKPRYDAISTNSTVWAKLAASLPEPIFIADLRFNRKGRYAFGEIPQGYTGVTFWDAGPDEKDFWKLPITSYMIHGNTEKINFMALIDTACSDICLPPCIVRRYYDTVPGSYKHESGVYIFPSGQTLPDLVLYIGDESRAVRILGKFLQPQGTLGDESFTRGTLQENSETWGSILGHPMFFGHIVVFKGVRALSVGLTEKSLEE